MREVNFSIPNVNKASVGITTALYDRRALDCTSTLPLINSLNHLAYLTTSSARIRDILTVDGGLERLVSILKAGRSKDMMDMWKWNLAFQCVVNIGVRGSENVRTRVVEADMVPVIATMLDNYLQIVDRCRDKVETEAKHNLHRNTTTTTTTTTTAGRLNRTRQHQHRQHQPQPPPPRRTNSTDPQFDRNRLHHDPRPSRRQAPPPSIVIPLPLPPSRHHDDEDDDSTEPTPMHVTPTPFLPPFVVSSPRDQTALTSPSRPPPHHHLHHHHHHAHSRSHHHHTRGQEIHAVVSTLLPSEPSSRPMLSQPGNIIPPMDRADGFGLRPVRDVDRLPSMASTFSVGMISRSHSPSTPHPPPPPLPSSSSSSSSSSAAAAVRSPTVTMSSVVVAATRSRARTAIRHRRSTSAESDDANVDENISDVSVGVDTTVEPIVDVQTTVGIQAMDDRHAMLEAVDTSLAFDGANVVSDTPEVETFNITHRSVVDGSLINPTPDPAAAAAAGAGVVGGGTLVMSPQRPIVDHPAPTLPATSYSRILMDRPAMVGVLATMPRDEDVLMSLQLLAYISKYCNLRSYFQNSHLVPRLKIGPELGLLDEDDDHRRRTGSDQLDDDDDDDDDNDAADRDFDEEYLAPDDFNIFPVVEKFTVRHHSTDMQYWAGVVMRNLCRKDDHRGGIRQCAYYRCGKWEKYTRQFAKCRRCRRTKYCSKECQKSAWVYHRHWCVAAQQ